MQAHIDKTLIGQRKSRNLSGFSLVELLVVIAIIGILAAVGAAGYNGYINATKDEASLANAETVDRAFDQDYIALVNEIGGPSEIATGVLRTTQCLEYVKTVTSKLNGIWKNAHNADDAYAVNLHKDTTDTTVAVSSLKPGQLGLQCANPSASVEESNFYVHRCTCVGAEDCTMHTFTSGDGSQNTATYEAHVNAIDPTLAWRTNGKVKLGTHVPDWVCPKADYYN